MATAEQRIKQLGIEIPPAPKPVAAYVPGVRAGAFVYTSGQLPTCDGQLVKIGKVPTELCLSDAQAAARQAVLNALGVVKAQIGTLDNVERIVRLNVFVNSAADFTDQASVANGASELLMDIFGSAGQHTRCAIGAAALPLNAPVELDLIVQVVHA